MVMHVTPQQCTPPTRQPGRWELQPHQARCSDAQSTLGLPVGACGQSFPMWVSPHDSLTLAFTSTPAIYLEPAFYKDQSSFPSDEPCPQHMSLGRWSLAPFGAHESPGPFRVTLLLRWQSWPVTYVIVVTTALGLSPFWGSESFLFALFHFTSPFLGLYSSTGQFRRSFLKKSLLQFGFAWH